MISRSRRLPLCALDPGLPPQTHGSRLPRRPPGRRFALCLPVFGLILLFCSLAAAQQPFKSITYRLSMSRTNSHLFEVTVEVELPEELRNKSVEFQMPKWSPGRYAVFDFAKNVQEFRAVGGICPPPAVCKMAPRQVTRVDDQTWSVAVVNSSGLTISYKVFGNDLSGTFSQLDIRHANYNGGSIFMY